MQKVDALLFMLGWDHYEFHKKRTRTRYDETVFLHSVGSAGHAMQCRAFGGTKHLCTIFHARVGQVQNPQIAHCDKLH
jgi:hypothetical protein